MAVRKIAHPSIDDRKAMGLEARDRASLSSHTKWRPAADRPDPVALLEEQNTTREPDLVPVRHGRMMVSPFTFYRGAAKIMAADLEDTPTAGLDAQLCGDAHLSNFGVFASPERRLLFDLNDFDETLPGPFEYDVKRMAASFTIAARNNGFTKADTRAATLASVRAYREAMAEFAQMRHDGHLVRAPGRGRAQGLDPQRGGRTVGSEGEEAGRQEEAGRRRSRRPSGEGGGSGRRRRPRRRTPATACRRCPSSASWSTAATGSSASRRSSSRSRDWTATYGLSAGEVDKVIHEQFRAYRATLQDDRRQLLERFEVVDVARKVVGVGSVGTRAFIVLLQGRDEQDPLFLQVKEATASVLEAYLRKSRYRQHGERVVQGQRMMQAASDIYLGWTKGVDVSRHFYWRQLRDMKGSALRRGDDAGRAHVLRAHLRVDAGAGARPVRRPGRHRRLPRRQRRVRPVDHRLLASATPTRTSGTTASSSTRSDPGGWRRSRASENGPRRRRPYSAAGRRAREPALCWLGSTRTTPELGGSRDLLGWCLEVRCRTSLTTVLWRAPSPGGGAVSGAPSSRRTVTGRCCCWSS